MNKSWRYKENKIYIASREIYVVKDFTQRLLFYRYLFTKKIVYKNEIYREMWIHKWEKCDIFRILFELGLVW